MTTRLKDVVPECLSGKRSPATDRISVLNLAANLMAICPDASIRNGAEAVTLADHAQQLTARQDAAILDTLSAAYAEAGRFPLAIETE